MSHAAPHTAPYSAVTKVHSRFISAVAISLRFFNIVSLAMIGSLALCAQTNTGSIRVFVYDETMAVIQDVTVTALDESRGVTRERIAPTPSSGIGIGGGNGRGNTFMIDGLDNLYNSGSVRSSISQNAVHEFQVNRNSFSTEQGGAPGGTINIVTKGGTNDVHGTLFSVLRNRRFQARNYFDPGKAAYTRAQFGLSTGGPIKRNRTFFYAAYERLDRHESQLVPLLADRSFLTSLTESQQSLVDALRFAPPTLTPLLRGTAASEGPGSYGSYRPPHLVNGNWQNWAPWPKQISN